MPRYKFQVMADGQRLYLHDGDFDFDAADDIEDLWTEAALRRKLMVANGLIGVATARSLYVPVEVEVRRDPPDENLSRWDAVVESGILVLSGDLFVSGSAFLSDEQLEVAPGCYLARVYYGGLGTVTSDLEGDDHYKVALWPVFRYSVQILKRWQPAKRGRSPRQTLNRRGRGSTPAEPTWARVIGPSCRQSVG